MAEKTCEDSKEQMWAAGSTAGGQEGPGVKGLLHENRGVGFTLTGICQALGIGEAFSSSNPG